MIEGSLCTLTLLKIKTPLSPFQKSSRTVEHIGSDGIERATTPTQAKRNAYASDDEDGGGEKEEEDMADGGDDSQSSATKRRLALLGQSFLRTRILLVPADSSHRTIAGL